MKKIFILFAVMLCTVSFAPAQKTAQKMNPKMMMQGAKETDEQYLTRFEMETASALLRGDTALLEKYIAEDSMLIDPAGMVFSKPDLVGMLKSGMLKFESSKFSEVKVRVYNGSTAIVTYLSEDKGMIKYPDGKTQDISGKYRWTDTFVKMKGLWMCVTTHGTAIMEAPMK